MLDITHEPFFIFGCGSRPKCICTPRGLVCWSTGESVVEFTEGNLVIDAASYTVTAETPNGSKVVIQEDEQGIWLTRNGQKEALSESTVALPDFAGHPYRETLRVLHHEILVNIVDGKPVPNFLVYDRPWYRDAAMMAMVLKHTGNLTLLEKWISSLSDPFDRNNAGNEEPDNLGQVLYMISLVGDSSHPMVETVIRAAKNITENGHLVGLTDFGRHSVYQTKWMKFGLAQLGLEDNFVVPQEDDSYASLFWWDKKDTMTQPKKPYHGSRDLYPYLTWAEAHFRDDPPPMHMAADSYPITWECKAGEADYDGMEVIAKNFVDRKLSMPHTWHAAEMFLYLLEL